MAMQYDFPALERLGGILRHVGFGQLVDAERRNQLDRYEPWSNVPSNFGGLAAELYNVLHVGQCLAKSSAHHAFFEQPSIDVFVHTEDNSIRCGDWRLSHFANMFCASDMRHDSTSSVYIGDDSFRFAEFLLSLPSTRRGLDIGSGSGISTIALAHNSQHVTGIDVVEECATAGRISAALNGFLSETHFETMPISQFVPVESFDIVVGNPPGVPVPSFLNYGLAGKGGESGLDMVMLFLDAARAFCRPDGIIAMRFQSIGNGSDILAHSRIASIAQANHWDVQFLVDIVIPIELRSALSTLNATPLNPDKKSSDILAIFDAHAQTLNATSYTSSLMLVHLNGSGRVTTQNLLSTIDLDSPLAPTNGRSMSLSSAEIGAVRAKYWTRIANLPGIFWRLGNMSQIFSVSEEMERMCRALLRSSTSRHAILEQEPECLLGDNHVLRALIVPFLLVADSMCELGLLSSGR